MTRALGIALVIAVALASVTAGFHFLFPRGPAPRRLAGSQSLPESGLARVVVLVAESPERAIVVKPRFFDEKRAEFTDSALARALGVPDGRWRFVEVWVVNRGAGDLSSLGTAPVVTAPARSSVGLKTLRELLPEGAARTSRAETLATALSPDAGHPLRKGAFRRSVYAMPGSLAFRDLVSAEVDGLRLEPRETTEEALETFVERPRPDLIAALSTPEKPPESSSRAAVTNKESR